MSITNNKTKVCTICNIEKDFYDYYCVNGINYYKQCKECYKINQKARRDKKKPILVPKTTMVIQISNLIGLEYLTSDNMTILKNMINDIIINSNEINSFILTEKNKTGVVYRKKTTIVPVNIEPE